MKKVIFFHYGNGHLKNAIVDRLVELGWENRWGWINNIILSDDGCLRQNSDFGRSGPASGDYIQGDLNLLFNTQEYAVPMRLFGEKVTFKDGGIKVGCRFVSGDKVEELYRHFKGE